jgi:hypothetical protein
VAFDRLIQDLIGSSKFQKGQTKTAKADMTSSFG